MARLIGKLTFSIRQRQRKHKSSKMGMEIFAFQGSRPRHNLTGHPVFQSFAYELEHLNRESGTEGLA